MPEEYNEDGYEKDVIEVPVQCINNLKLLRNYLSKPSLHIYTDFHMQFYCGFGAAGCAVGHGPFAGVKKMQDETWLEYSDRVFMPRDTYGRRLLREWMFSDILWGAPGGVTDHLATAARVLDVLNAASEQITLQSAVSRRGADVLYPKECERIFAFKDSYVPVTIVY